MSVLQPTKTEWNTALNRHVRYTQLAEFTNTSEAFFESCDTHNVVYFEWNSESLKITLTTSVLTLTSCFKLFHTDNNYCIIIFIFVNSKEWAHITFISSFHRVFLVVGLLHCCSSAFAYHCNNHGRLILNDFLQIHNVLLLCKFWYSSSAHLYSVCPLA